MRHAAAERVLQALLRASTHAVVQSLLEEADVKARIADCHSLAAVGCMWSSHIARRRLAKTTKSRRLLPLPPPRLRHGGARACRAAQRCLRTPMEPKEDEAIHSCYTGTRRDRVGQVHEAALCTHDDARQDVVSLHSVHKTE